MFSIPLKHIQRTERIGSDADDPAMWIPNAAGGRFYILGTNKASAADGGSIVVLDDAGSLRLTIDKIDRPNNIHVLHGMRTNRGRIDIAISTERLSSRLRIWELTTNGSTPSAKELIPSDNGILFRGESGDAAAPMGVTGIVTRDGQADIYVSRKSGPRQGYVHHLRLNLMTTRPTLTFVRAIVEFSGTKEMEALAISGDQKLLYAADERFGIHRIRLSDGIPAGIISGKPFQGDQEGIVSVTIGGKRVVICTDQIPSASRYFVYDERNPAAPLGVFTGQSDETDGIDASDRVRTAQYPNGILVAMHSAGACFDYYALPERLPRA